MEKNVKIVTIFVTVLLKMTFYAFALYLQKIHYVKPI